MPPAPPGCWWHGRERGKAGSRGGEPLCVAVDARNDTRFLFPSRTSRGTSPLFMQRASSSPDKARWGEGGEFEGREDRSRASRGVLPPLKPFCLQNAETPAVPPGLRHHISPYQGICRPVMTGTVPPVLPFSAVPADRPPAGPGAAAGPSGAGRPRCRSRP